MSDPLDVNLDSQVSSETAQPVQDSSTDIIQEKQTKLEQQIHQQKLTAQQQLIDQQRLIAEKAMLEERVRQLENVTKETSVLKDHNRDLKNTVDVLKSQMDSLLKSLEDTKKQQEEEKVRNTIRSEVEKVMRKKNLQQGEFDNIEKYINMFTFDIDGNIVSKENMAHGVTEHIDNLVKKYPYLQKQSVPGNVAGSSHNVVGINKTTDQITVEDFPTLMSMALMGMQRKGQPLNFRDAPATSIF